MLTETTTVDNITVIENGVILVRTVTKIFRDNTEISKSYHRASLEPGQDITNQDQRVQDIANAVWTQEVINAYQGN